MNTLSGRKSISLRRAVIGLIVLGIIASASGPSLACGIALAPGTVTGVVDERTVSLQDGRQIRLAGLEFPADLDLAGTAREMLAIALLNQPVTLRAPGTAKDRYGRTEALVIAGGQGLDRSIQQAMLERGLARVSARIGDRACAAGFLASESQARSAKRGLWAEAKWAIRPANDPAAIAALRGEFAVVEGRVVSVRESGGTIYVNFGRRRSEAFTATVAKRNERALLAGALDVKRLEKRMIRVRGWVEERNGPWIDVTRPEQIELVGP